MAGELVSLRLLLVSDQATDGDMMRHGAAAAAIPSELTHVATVAAACGVLAEAHIDLAFLDSAIPEREQSELAAAIRAARGPPALVLIAPSGPDAAALASGAAADAIVARPAKVPEARALIESCSRLKVPSRALVVDDSSTMRTIVRKILEGCRFPLEIAEAKEGIDGLKQICAGKFDLVFLDYNMPGLNGFDMLAQIKRQHPRIGVVMMTSVQDDTLAERARAAGAAAFLKKPFYPSDIDAVLYAFHHLQPPVPAGR
jgi:CheY-like chemotaxis protein